MFHRGIPKGWANVLALAPVAAGGLDGAWALCQQGAFAPPFIEEGTMFIAEYQIFVTRDGDAWALWAR